MTVAPVDEIRAAIARAWKRGDLAHDPMVGLAIVDWLEHELQTATSVEPVLIERNFAHALAIARAYLASDGKP